MHDPMPPLHEEVAALKERLPHEHDGPKKPRLQRLDLLASRQAHTRQDGARRLGVPRHTVSRWLALSVTGGLAALLMTDIPVGHPVSLAPAVLASLPPAAPRLRRCAAGCGRRLGWRAGHNAGHAGPHARQDHPDRGAPSSHTKTPAAIPVFQATCQTHLQRGLPSPNTRLICVCSPDARRLGFRMIRRRRLTVRGVPHVFPWGAV
jgi:hypothetical protein